MKKLIALTAILLTTTAFCHHIPVHYHNSYRPNYRHYKPHFHFHPKCRIISHPVIITQTISIWL